MHFLEWKCIPSLVHIMAWRRPGDKPLFGPMMVYLADAYMRHSALMSCSVANQFRGIMIYTDMCNHYPILYWFGVITSDLLWFTIHDDIPPVYTNNPCHKSSREAAGRMLSLCICKMVKIDEIKFGFCHGKDFTHAIFIARQLWQEYIATNKLIYFAFFNLEETFNVQCSKMSYGGR